jgi:hypothetical protein
MIPRYDPSARGWQRLEHQLARYTLTSGPSDPAVEALRFPGLVNAYRATCPAPDAAPVQAAYEDWVQHLLAKDWDRGRLPPDWAAVRARAGRAYISLVVQHHAYLVLQESFGAVAWDDDLDMRYGVDLVVIGDGAVAVGLALRAPTPRSREQAARKVRSYGALPFSVHTLEVEPHAYTAGPFWLYRPEVLRLVVTDALAAHWAAKARALEAAADLAYRDGRRRPKASRRDFMDGVAAAVTALGDKEY